jgi:hypothetical protein
MCSVSCAWIYVSSRSDSGDIRLQGVSHSSSASGDWSKKMISSHFAVVLSFYHPLSSFILRGDRSNHRGFQALAPNMNDTFFFAVELIFVFSIESFTHGLDSIQTGVLS